MLERLHACSLNFVSYCISGAPGAPVLRGPPPGMPGMIPPPAAMVRKNNVQNVIVFISK